ncbi:hypothetical protein [Gordonia sp. N1V]|uniref:hypothetical protein n=1 Tax=Gordonia sp. N1V TaxID=3034163 RepID=UPI0023E1E72B|nr:hypothetical protein [Gordonia sp. N1V]MDF3283900.1 hypothetical protein [Gordonia sp. N1V]
MDLFAAVPVTDLQRSIDWFDRLLGAVDTFDPNDTERVWTLAAHLHLYAVVAPDDAGHGGSRCSSTTSTASSRLPKSAA